MSDRSIEYSAKGEIPHKEVREECISGKGRI
jgi:hypothetical protein